MLKLIFSIFFLISCGASDLSGDGLISETISGNGDVSGSITDGSDGSALSGVTVSISGTSFSTTTNGSGAYSFSSVPVGTYAIDITFSGYIGQTISSTLRNDITNEINVSMLTSAYAAGKIVIILTWNTTVADLDSHLYVPLTSSSTEHVKYNNRGDTDGTLNSAPFAGLDVDDTNGEGPETMALAFDGSTTHYARTYRYFVHNFVQANTSTDYFKFSSAKVRVYKEGILSNEFDVSSTSTSEYWHVFDIDQNGNVSTSDTYSSSAPATLY